MPKRMSLGFPLLIALLGLLFFIPLYPRFATSVVGAQFCDVLSMFYPLRHFANSELQMGRLPLWNPYILCGHPFHAEGQGAIFYPLNLALAYLPAAISMNLFALAHFILGGIFFYLYLRACGLQRFSAFFGAFVYLFSSGPISRLYAGHFTIIPFLALVPAMLWVWQLWLNNRKWTYAGWGAIVLGCMILAGYPQLLLYASIYIGWFGLIAFLQVLRKVRIRAAFSPIFFLLVIFVIGICVGAVQLFPSYAFAKDSFRQQASYEFISSFSFAPENLLTFLFPRLFGDLEQGLLVYWGRNYLWEMWIYIGIVPLALAIMTMVTVRSRLVAAHGLAVLIFLLLALGKHSPIHRLMYEVVPFFNYFRGSSKFSLFVLISLCALTAIGVDRVLVETELKKRRQQILTVGVTFGVFFAIALVLWLVFNNGSATLANFVNWRIDQGENFMLFARPEIDKVWLQASPQLIRTMILALVALAGLVLIHKMHTKKAVVIATLAVLVFPELWLFASKEFVTAPVPVSEIPPEILMEIKNDPASPRVLAPATGRNGVIPLRVETMLGYVGNMPARYNNFLTAVTGMPRHESMAGTPIQTLNDRLFYPNIYYLILPEKSKVKPGATTPLVRKNKQVLYRLTDVEPRAYFSAKYQTLTSKESALNAVETRSADIRQTDLIEVPASKTAPDFAPTSAGDEVSITEKLPRRMTLRTKTFGPRMLVLTDTYEAGWKCRIDGKEEIPIYPANIAFRAVRVPEGEHTLTFSYEPSSFKLGVVTSIAGLIAVILLLIVGRRFTAGATQTAPATTPKSPENRAPQRR